MILIVDLGSQYTHLIWRSLRDLGKESKIVNAETPQSELLKSDMLIVSGGPGSVEKDAYTKYSECSNAIKQIYESKEVPLLGICLGHQLIAHVLGGKVVKGRKAEYGFSRLVADDKDLLFDGMPKEFKIWVSHFDEIKKLPKDFVKLAHSETCAVEAIRHKKKNIFGLQFHPEVWHTENGEKILANLLTLLR
ncbi:GMP synthase [Candidatus Micrarchaeota archaeon CG_4_10_14_0_2_um_filter_49_7]|nr:MAG: hypothetical protein AUJ13_05100 [Candidatus Micrarchaeota archaeon CG1_02_49_24]PIZ99776.1 MAG: GMP synthase [Candidatus Micrarchaeota archaeon CG_4_10_14_0_2_um_filter_49_7]HII53734.1 GMP synthase subunit A [Candidatus Micrarchaeota archaeon]